jgi:hypothetical protein
MSSSNQLCLSLGQTRCRAIRCSETLLIPVGFFGQYENIKEKCRHRLKSGCEVIQRDD